MLFTFFPPLCIISSNYFLGGASWIFPLIKSFPNSTNSSSVKLTPNALSPSLFVIVTAPLCSQTTSRTTLSLKIF